MTRLYVIKEETRRRCRIIPASKANAKMFQEVSLELFHFFYETRTLDFPLFVKANDEFIEYIKPEEFSYELLDQMHEAFLKETTEVVPCILTTDKGRYQRFLDQIREKKIDALWEKENLLDRKTLEIFADLSAASQMIVRGGITKDVARQATESAAKLVDSMLDSDAAIATLTRMINADPTLYDHSASVAMISGIIASRVLSSPMPRQEAKLVATGGLYHDVGKTCVPNHVLNKPGRLTKEEFEIMKTHTTLGHDELTRSKTEGAPIDDCVIRVALEHHERFHGQGYPHGRKGRLEEQPNGIHLYTRIVTIADVYSALLMRRVYKPAYEAAEAIRIMADVAEREYDPEIFYPFLKSVVKSLNSYYSKQKEREKMKGKGRILLIENGKVKIS